MDPTVLDAFRDEAGAFTRAVGGLSTVDWDRPTRCAPWAVRDLVAHVRTGMARVPGMLAGPAPGRAGVTAAGYFRADGRFGAQTDAARIESARADAADSPAAAVADLDAAWRGTADACARQPDGRTVVTRHGDAMLLTEFLVTRVVEVALHGLDLADAVDRPAWLTPSAGEVVLGLLFGPRRAEAVRATGGDAERTLRMSTGRAPLDPATARRLEAAGIRWLTLGGSGTTIR